MIKFLKNIKNLFSALEEVKQKLSEMTLEDGRMIEVDETLVPRIYNEDGTLGEVLADGMYKLIDGTEIEVMDGVIVPKIVEEPVMEQPIVEEAPVEESVEQTAMSAEHFSKEIEKFSQLNLVLTNEKAELEDKLAKQIEKFNELNTKFEELNKQSIEKFNKAKDIVENKKAKTWAEIINKK
jgi:hypothetical protein